MLQQDTMHGMREHLERLEKSGTALYLNGKQTTAAELAKAYFINEEDVYMPDYVLDETGRVTQLRYDQIRMF